VTQRTREIGVRRALGAPRQQIIREVLAESALVALAGGTVGLLSATLLVSAVAGAVNLPIRVEWTTMVYSLAASAASGIVAGWYPARRAVRLDVIEAIRTE
jgi:ABC-type antimicrobial peptide transport system permease subunit